MLEGRARWEERRRQRPDRPWLWRDDWAEGKVVWRALGGRTTWALAIVYNAILGTVALVTPLTQIREASPATLAALALLPLGGLVLIGAAVRRTLRGRDYGLFTLELETVPATPGGQLRGAIQAVCGASPGDGFDVRLTCLRTKVVARTGASSSIGWGANRLTHSRPLWQTVYNTPALPGRDRPDVVTLPVHFDLPDDLPETTRDLPEPFTRLVTRRGGNISICDSLQTMAGLPPVGTEWISWRLAIHGSLPTQLSTCSFDVPVFSTPATESGRAVQPGFEIRRSSFASVGGLRFEPVLGGGSQVVFPARSNFGCALACCLLVAIGSSLVAWVSAGAREIAGVIAALAFLFAGLFVAAVARSVKRIRIGDDEIAVTLGRWGLSRTKRFRTDQVAAIAADGMYGEEEGATFACAIRSRDGRSFRFDTTLGTDTEAETLINEIRDRVGLGSAG